jgi:serine/threonine-protein kinase
VRETVPDVQDLRGELSAATAAVVDRAVAKDLRQRYPDAATMLADLEDVLAIETARAGQATGEATSVLRTLPGRTRRRLPFRARHPVRWLAALVLLGAIIAAVLVLALGNTHRGTGVAAGVSSSAGLVPVPLSQTAAHDYNPFGTGPENRDRIQNVVDSDPNTSWSTQQYYAGTLEKAGGVGTGLYLDAAPGVLAKAIEIQTPTPGFGVQIYAAPEPPVELAYGSSTPLTARGWQGPVGATSAVRNHTRVAITVGKPFRYYLVWITTLPRGSESASISDLTLFR